MIVGQSLTIDCQAKGKPEPRVIWKKSKVHSSPANFKTVISGSKIQALVNGSLYFVEVNLDDSGAYMCEASNDIGSPLSTIIQVTVYGKRSNLIKFIFYNSQHFVLSYSLLCFKPLHSLQKGTNQ